MKKRPLLFMILLFLGNMILYAQCSVNAGGNAAICGTSYTLQGSSSGNTSGIPIWTLVSKPSGAPDPVISNINSLTPNVTGMTYPGNYVFQVAQNCSPSGSATSQVTVTAPGDVSTFTAGPDITNVSAVTGTTTLNGVVPAGYTASWRFYNIYSKERYNEEIIENAAITNGNTASPTLTLIKKANHDTDPAYRAILRITSVNNPSCWYEDDAIVRFIPNPQINVASISFCGTNNLRYANLSNSPIFDTTQPNSSGNVSFGTTVTLNVVSQPAGGNMSYKSIDNRDINFNGITVPGVYTYTVTVTNASGTYTTPEITFNYLGQTPKEASLLDAAHPEQMEYIFQRSAGAVYCNKVGDTNPITFYYKLNSSDSPSLVSTVSNIGTTPPGGSPSLSENGAGTMNRSVTVTPPAGGWQAGTYVVRISLGTGCTLDHHYYIHISDGNRPNVAVNNMTVCYSGTGSVSATVPLPAVYKGVVNSSYFQDFAGRYDFTVVSKPAGSGTPVYQTTNLRTITNTSTIISNLDKEGEYVFKIKAVPDASSVGPFLDKEYACSGSSLEGTFSIFVSAQVGANAGSAQTLAGTSQTAFNGNNPGVATGAWTLLSKPSGATDPVIVTPSAYNTNVTGFNTPGVYTFRWTVTTGTCVNTSDLTVTVTAPAPGGVAAAVWYKADAGVYSNAGTTAAADNATVQQWNDQMGTGYNLIQATAARKPIFSNQSTLANFNPTVTFTRASTNWMAADPGSGNTIINRTQGSIYVAGKMNAVGATKTSFAGFDQTMNYPGLSTSNTNPSDKLMFYSGGTYNSISTNLFVAQKPFVAGSSWLNGGGTPNTNVLAKAWLDGNENIYNNTSLNVNTGNGFRIFRVGGDTDWGSHDGQLNEAIVFANPLSASEKARVDSYLSVKWGSTLSGDYVNSGNNVVWTASAAYQNNILGIARDNLSVLYQKQSRSENPGQKLIIGAGNSLANTNASNINTLTDGQYLLTGDNGLAQRLTVPLAYTAGTNGEVNHRFEAAWKTQNSGNVGTVTVAWPKGVKNLYLVQSPDETFDTTDTFTPMTTEITVNGVAYNTVNVTLADGQFFTFAGLITDSCVNGCNDNTFLNATNPNTIEYDNIVASEAATIVKQKDGSFYIWGYGVSPNVSTSNSNVVLNLLTPTKIAPATSLPGSGSGFNYTGTPLRVTTSGGGSGNDALVLLTTDGLYTWGRTIFPISLRSTGNFRFGKQSVNGKADGLPPGVNPTDVKMMVANQESLTITTCKGEVWSYNSGYYGDGAPVNAANNVIWHRVMTSATETLDNVVAVRGIWNTKFALTSDSKLYTWGSRTFLNDNNGPIISDYATEISVPTGVTPKMIGMTEGVNEGESSYYLLATNGKLYVMGYNSQRQLGDGTVTQRNNWVEITATDTDTNGITHSLGGNIAWISPAEHTNDYPSINVLTTDGKQWGWGYNLRQQLGSSTSPYYIDPRYMPGNGTAANQLGLNDKVIAVEDGGFHAINFKEGSSEYGFIGINTYGSMGDGSSVAGTTVNKYTYISPLDLCGIAAAGFCYKPGILTGTTLDTKVGITALGRAGAGSDNWPMVRKGGWLALEAKTKGFVPNRVAFDASGNPVGIPAANFVEGMMVYDTTNKCMKMYTLKEGGTSLAWHCVTTQACPD